MTRINMGCGDSPIDGWENFDNSFSVWLARHSLLASIFCRFLPIQNRKFVEFARQKGIRYCNATRIPVSDGTATAIFSSHMLEHLDRTQAEHFVREAFRVLAPAGVLRITVPDLDEQISLYTKYRDADRFMRHTMLGREDANGTRARLKHLLFGDRAHLWMYNNQSLSALMTAAGFASVQPAPQGKTAIHESGKLDLQWREEGSITVEGIKPS